MKTLFRLLFICFCILPAKLFCQDFDNYMPIEPTGKVPERFIIPTVKKYQKDVAGISKKENGRTRRAMKEFYLDANYEVDELLHSGKVLYNDPLSDYVNRVLDQLLSNNPDLRKQVEVYIVKSGEVNAFTHFNGTIFVTMGMLAKVRSEAELAFILGHEVTHYEKQHGIDKFVLQKDIDRGRGRFGSASDVQKLLARRAYSKDKETEADEGALAKYLKTSYSKGDAISSFDDVMEYSELPFDTIPFDKKFIESEGLSLPQSYFLDKPTPVKPLEDGDTFSTHPGSEARKQHIISLFKNTDFNGSKKFLVGESEFYKVQKMARYELSTIELEDFNYEKSLYNSYLLMKTYGDGRYVKRSVALALYGIAKYQDHHRFDKIVSYYNEYQGAPQQIYYLFEQLHYSESNTLALKYVWNVSKTYPADEEMKAMAADLIMEEEYNYYPFKKDEDKEKSPKEVKTKSLHRKDRLAYRQNNPIAEKKAPVSETKIEKVNVFSQDISETYIDKAVDIHDSLTKYPIEYLRRQPDFERAWSEQQKIADTKKDEDIKKNNPAYIKIKERENKRLAKGGYALGIGKILFLAPYYEKVNNSGYLLVQSQNAKAELEKNIREDAKAAHLRAIILDAGHLTPASTDTFNDITLLEKYFNASLEHDSIDFVDYKDENIQALSKKYGTKYICQTAIVSFQYEHPLNTLNVFALIIYPFAPYYIYSLLRRDFYSVAFVSVVNMETGKVEMKQALLYHQKDTKDLVKGIVFSICKQIKRKKA